MEYCRHRDDNNWRCKALDDIHRELGYFDLNFLFEEQSYKIDAGIREDEELWDAAREPIDLRIVINPEQYIFESSIQSSAV